MQLYCKYGVDPSKPDQGFVYAVHEDGQAIDPKAYPGCVLVPFDGQIETLGKFGSEPALLGEPPTAIDPKTKKVYEDKRHMADDTRHPAAPKLTSDILIGYAASERYAKEISGITVDGIPVATDRASQAAVEKLASRAARDAQYAPTFKASDGTARALTAAQAIAISDAVDDYVQACRAAEAAIVADIKAGKVTTLAAVDQALAAVDKPA